MNATSSQRFTSWTHLQLYSFMWRYMWPNWMYWRLDSLYARYNMRQKRGLYTLYTCFSISHIQNKANDPEFLHWTMFFHWILYTLESGGRICALNVMRFIFVLKTFPTRSNNRTKAGVKFRGKSVLLNLYIYLGHTCVPLFLSIKNIFFKNRMDLVVTSFKIQYTPLSPVLYLPRCLAEIFSGVINFQDTFNHTT